MNEKNMNEKERFIMYNSKKEIKDIFAYLFKTNETNLSDSENLFFNILSNNELNDLVKKRPVVLENMRDLLSSFISSYKLDSSPLREKLELIEKAQVLEREKNSKH